MRRRDSGSCALARCIRLEGIIIDKEVPAEVLLGRVRLRAGMIEFALDRGKRPSLRKAQAATTDNALFTNLL